MATNNSNNKKVLTYTALWLVVIFWAVNMGMDVYLKDAYDPSPLVHASFMMVLGKLLGYRIGKSEE